uniref:Uncharacterized protein n=2 Tax=Tanacetum cinerariifolium TaxID=118510 RepID=A0A699IFG9_TANCI|nr:hypothetical protein [Tanacetum cinerariifolium]
MNEVRGLICDMAPQTTRPVSSLLETNGCIGKPRFTEERTNIVYNANKHRKVVGLLIEDVAAIMIQTALRAFERPGRLQKKCVKDWRSVLLSHCFLICLLFMIPRL